MGTARVRVRVRVRVRARVRIRIRVRVRRVRVRRVRVRVRFSGGVARRRLGIVAQLLAVLVQAELVHVGEVVEGVGA